MTINKGYIDWVLSLRKDKRLHSEVENRLTFIISKVFPEYQPVAEVQGVAGGRNDLTLFEYSGKKVLFEILATKSQVSRDLRILDKTKADIKVAIIIDKEADNSVFEQFVRENPEDSYPYIFINELYEKTILTETALKLKEIIYKEDTARVHRFLKKEYSKETFDKFFTKEKIQFLTNEDIKKKSITLEKVFITLILYKLIKFGVKKEKLLEIGKALSKDGVIDFQIERMQIGLSVFIYSDFKGNMGFYSDNELQDFLHIGHELSEPYILLSLNATFKEIVDKYYKGNDLKFPNEIRISSCISTLLRNPDGNVVLVSVPKNTTQISILAPMDERDKNGKLNDDKKKKYLDMINVE